MAVNAKNWQELTKPNALEKKQSGADAGRDVLAFPSAETLRCLCHC